MSLFEDDKEDGGAAPSSADNQHLQAKALGRLRLQFVAERVPSVLPTAALMVRVLSRWYVAEIK